MQKNKTCHVCSMTHTSQLCRHVSTLRKTYLLLQCSTLIKTTQPWKLYDWGWNRRKHNVEQVWNASPVAICYGLLGQVIIEDDLTQQDREMFRKQLHYSDNRVSWKGNRFLKKSKQDIYQWFGETQRPGDKTQQLLGSTRGVLPKKLTWPKSKMLIEQSSQVGTPQMTDSYPNHHPLYMYLIHIG